MTQSRHALGRIATDETRHAALSWSLAGWMQTQLGVVQRREVARRGAQAAERLEDELTQERDPRVHTVTGLPAPAQARGLYRALMRGHGLDRVLG